MDILIEASEAIDPEFHSKGRHDGGEAAEASGKRKATASDSCVKELAWQQHACHLPNAWATMQ